MFVRLTPRSCKNRSQPRYTPIISFTACCKSVFRSLYFFDNFLASFKKLSPIFNHPIDPIVYLFRGMVKGIFISTFLIKDLMIKC